MVGKCSHAEFAQPYLSYYTLQLASFRQYLLSFGMIPPSLSSLRSDELFHSFIVKLRGLPWSFKWGIFSPLACTQALGICTVAYFPATASREVEELRYRMPYLVVCFSLALLNVLLSE